MLNKCGSSVVYLTPSAAHIRSWNVRYWYRHVTASSIMLHTNIYYRGISSSLGNCFRWRFIERNSSMLSKMGIEVFCSLISPLRQQLFNLYLLIVQVQTDMLPNVLCLTEDRVTTLECTTTSHHIKSWGHLHSTAKYEQSRLVHKVSPDWLTVQYQFIIGGWF